jgi:hypothetical protein
MMMLDRLILAAIVVAVAVPAAGQAPSGATGRVTAFACAPLPSPLRIVLEVSDGSPYADRLKRVLVRALAARDAIVTPGAPLRLSLYVGAVREPEIRKGRDLGRFSRGNSSDQRTQFRINLWSNQRDSVIGGRRDKVLASAVDELHVEITLDDRSDGQCVWQGEVVHRLEGGDELAAAERIIPLLIDRLGRSARAELIELD